MHSHKFQRSDDTGWSRQMCEFRTCPLHLLTTVHLLVVFYPCICTWKYIFLLLFFSFDSPAIFWSIYIVLIQPFWYRVIFWLSRVPTYNFRKRGFNYFFSISKIHRSCTKFLFKFGQFWQNLSKLVISIHKDWNWNIASGIVHWYLHLTNNATPIAIMHGCTTF